MTKEDSKAMASFREVKHSWRSSLAVVEFWKIGQGKLVSAVDLLFPFQGGRGSEGPAIQQDFSLI